MSGEIGPLADLFAFWSAGAQAAAKGERVPRPEHCAGAVVRVSRAEALSKQLAGAKFDTDPHDLPPQGREPMRLRCHGKAFVDGDGVDYGLCKRCITAETRNRQYLGRIAEEEQKAADAPKRRGFSEEAR